MGPWTETSAPVRPRSLSPSGGRSASKPCPGGLRARHMEEGGQQQSWCWGAGLPRVQTREGERRLSGAGEEWEEVGSRLEPREPRWGCGAVLGRVLGPGPCQTGQGEGQLRRLQVRQGLHWEGPRPCPWPARRTRRFLVPSALSFSEASWNLRWSRLLRGTFPQCTATGALGGRTPRRWAGHGQCPSS